MNVQAFVECKEKIQANCARVIIGKENIVEQVLICLIASGHVLLEDVPGTGKTMLLRAFSKSIGGDFKRIQFTPDLLPSDLTGINFYNQSKGEFEFRKGPLFANLILADEINRAVPRSQSALLEVMEEKQISVDGDTYKMQEPYMVMATQNPVESYGTFPLPEAQLDRFFMKMSLGFMSKEEEIAVLERPDSKVLVESLEQVMSWEELSILQMDYAKVTVSKDVANYILDIITATRTSDMLAYGVSTRGSLALYRASQIYAAMQGRDFVIPEDVKKEAVYVLSHRISMLSKNHMDNTRFIVKLLDSIPVPLENV